MKSRARTFMLDYPNTKIVRVTNTLFYWSVANQCYNNALYHKEVFGSKMVAGWKVTDGAYSMNPNRPRIFGVRHWWNKLQGRYIDTTPFINVNDDDVYTYVLNKEVTEDAGWITPETDHVQYVY